MCDPVFDCDVQDIREPVRLRDYVRASLYTVLYSALCSMRADRFRILVYMLQNTLIQDRQGRAATYLGKSPNEALLALVHFSAATYRESV